MILKRHLKIAAMIAASFLIAGMLIQHIWNLVLSGVFSLPDLTFLQASGIFVLSNLLLGPLMILLHRKFKIR